LESPGPLISFATYTALLAISFLAATLVPMGSEPALIAALVAKSEPAWALIMTAAIGNTAGSTVNWALGRGLETYRGHRYFPVPADHLARAQIWYQRYGKWSLLLSWMPVIGDALTLAAGVMRENFLTFVLITGFAKTARYVVVAAGLEVLL
jgi:membrane protein YqaA with SNARE-associated domain